MSDLGDKLVEIKRQKDTYILPENIKKDVTVYGVTGTLEAGSGGGDVKLFETVEEMQQDTTSQEGDLALVYREELTSVTQESEFDSCTFPNEVVLSEAFTDSIYGSFRPVDSSGSWFDGMVDMSSSGFRFDGYGDSGEIRVEYESTDGVTYTRTDGGEELQEFGIIIKWEDYGEGFNSVIGNFMKIGGNYFGGLYEYKCNYENHNKRLLPLMSNISVDFENNNVTFDFSNNSTFVMSDEVLKLANKIANENQLDNKSCALFLDINDNLHLIRDTNNNYASNSGIAMYNQNETAQYPAFYVGSDTTQSVSYTDYILDVANQTYTHTSVTFITANYGVNNYRYNPDILLKTYPIGLFMRTTNESSSWCFNKNDFAPFKLSNETTVGANVGDNYSYDIWLIEDTYISVNTQLDAISEYVYEKTFYGKNGVEDGILTTNVSNSFADVNAELVYKIQQQYDNMQPRILTDSDKKISKNIYFIPVKKDGTPLLNTSNVTNMQFIFTECYNLMTIPLLDTSNVINMSYMFNLCSNLEMIPLLNTGNVTDMSYMFSNCSSLTTIPLLNTGNVTNMLDMFYGCTSLTEMQLLDTSNVTNMTDMFLNCISLNNNSLNNILAMCINSAVTSNKTLKKIGLSSTQAQICTTLSNYQTFVNAGWTTGY